MNVISKLALLSIGLGIIWGQGVVQLLTPGSRNEVATDPLPVERFTVRELGCYEVRQMMAKREWLA